MSSRLPTLDSVQSHRMGLVKIPVRALLDAANAPTLVGTKPIVSSVTRLAQGVFRVRLADQFPSIESYYFKVRAAAHLELFAQEKGDDPKPAGAGAYVDVRLVDHLGAETDPPAKGDNVTELIGEITVRTML